jgi:hypothetical protein
VSADIWLFHPDGSVSLIRIKVSDVRKIEVKKGDQRLMMWALDWRYLLQLAGAFV